ncbi:MAG: NAD(P)/FAD-dependent oxidoreductase [Rhodoglobus sp.]
MTESTVFDVIVIGGGAAGLSAAVTLGRARRSVLVIDAGEPRNAPAAGVHGFLTRDGMPPRELVREGRVEAERYGVRFVDARATSSHRVDEGFAVETGKTYRSRRLVVATGLIDELPQVEGLAERWGRDAIHCPYCHGWEVLDRAIGILATGPRAVHQALMFTQWSDDVTLFTHTAPPLSEEDREKLEALGVPIIDGEVTKLTVANDELAGLELAGGVTHPVDALVIGAPMRARSEVLESLGILATEHEMGVGTHLASTPGGATAVEGVWVAGNVTDLMAQVVVAAAAGVMVGAQVNAHLLEEEVQEAVARHRRTLKS